MSFCNSHVHTEDSNIRLLDCIIKPKAAIDKAIEQGLTGICITDHECLSCHSEVNEYAKQIKEQHPNFTIGLGDEIYLVDERTSGIKYYHFILIAKNAIGHRALREISSLAWLHSYTDRRMERVPITKSELAAIVKKFPNSLIAQSACLGSELDSEILALTAAEKKNNIEEILNHKQKIHDFIMYCKDLFGEDFYLEAQPATSKEQIICNKRFLSIAKAYDLKITVATDAHYLSKEDRWVHKAYLTSKGGERETDSFYEFTYMMPPDEVKEFLRYSYTEQEIEQIFAASNEIASKIEFYDLFHKQTILEVPVKDYPKKDNELIDYPNLSQMFKSDNIQERYWVNQCIEALKQKQIYDDAHLARLEEEAITKKVIGQKLETNMFAYPITLQHYINLFWQCGSIVGAGRGSSGAGLNHYLLGITQVDPLDWGFPWFRYLNEERTELGDIDLDLCPSKRPYILQEIKKERQQFFDDTVPQWARENLGCSLVATFGSESAKSAVLSSARGYRSEEYPDGIDVDIAQYLSSLIPQERGQLWSLRDVVYGDSDKNRAPISTFVKEVEKYPGLLQIMLSIESLHNKRSSHASGVIMFDKDPFTYCAFMKTPKGEIITQYDLHSAERMGNTKYDFLVTEVSDKIVKCIELLQEDNQIDANLSLREVYNKFFHPEVLPIKDKKYWDALCSQKVLNVFQFDSIEGSKGIAQTQPRSIEDLTNTNGLIRLVGDGNERPLDRYVRFKNDLSLWYQEMDDFGLTKEEQSYLEPYFKSAYGTPPDQERLMLMLMDKNLCHFTLSEANTARKVVGKKKMDQIPIIEEKVLNQATSPLLGQYIWEHGAKPQMSYSFSQIHATVYSLIGFQTVYAATNWNPIYWNTACLIVNSGGEDGSTDYAKIAKAIGDITGRGVKVSLVDINSSTYDFKPDAKNNRILYGLKALTAVGDEVIQTIINNRPYKTVKDFINKVNPKKNVMFNLIKAGAFDSMEDRMFLMGWYVWHTCEKKKQLTLANMRGLIAHNLVPQDLAKETAVFEFNRYLKACCVYDKENYKLDARALTFLTNNFIDLYSTIDENELLNIKVWDKIYQKEMNPIREWLKTDTENILFELNKQIFKEDWIKYAKRPNYSAWEMESMCFYFHDHELKNINNHKYGLVDYEDLSKQPYIERSFVKNGKTINMYSLHKIIGTVIAKNATKSTIYLLTRNGSVVPVKFRKEYFALFDKRISQIQPDGKKKVIEQSWFNRGNMLIINGLREDSGFFAKKYASQSGHTLYRVTSIDDNGNIQLTSERAKGIEEEDEDSTYVNFMD